MKFKLLAFTTSVVLLLASCGEVELPPKYLTINGEEYSMVKAIIEDYGPDEDITYRQYQLSFRDKAEEPSTYLEFFIYSTSTTRLQEGVYVYDDWGYEAGTLSSNELGLGLKYDSDGYAVAGKRLDDWDYQWAGTITVDMKDGDYDITFDLTIDVDGEMYTIEGEYNAPLTEGYIW